VSDIVPETNNPIYRFLFQNEEVSVWYMGNFIMTWLGSREEKKMRSEGHRKWIAKTD
jgi:hypothetical protein